ncbi:DUF2612 domain-containing protein [Formicincola oecophyllae]|uniref:DUF2612 domain-containing protein n=1 Tax=Formicincola oecophyllae TaxID=2558361 RepID=A0A4Y6U9I9_9PROT|nr:DUF2612 domain-containing protein [Formicincola oecophyllae]QDH14139.1 DUF2612 domain-containing protein [Formicincola oecophyllae]
MEDIRPTILAQYANSPALVGILARFNAAADPRLLLEMWFQHVWDPSTATGWGLDVWGRIVGVSRVLKTPSTGFWGFEQGDDGSGTSLPFDEGIFYTGQPTTGNYRLTDEAFRRLVFAKAAANICGGSTADINRVLMLLFGGAGKRIWVEDGQDMTMTVRYAWRISALDAALLENAGVLPRPSGVALSFAYTPDTTN